MNAYPQNLFERFETWFKHIHGSTKSLRRRPSGEYIDESVQEMYLAYRGGFSKATREQV